MSGPSGAPVPAGSGGRGLTLDRLRSVLAGLVILLLVVPVGGALWLGVAHGESPCILCWAQRTSMLLVALTGVFVVRYGPKPRYLGLVVLLAAWGIWMGTRHSALHLARDVGQGFAGAILGGHTYTWSWFIHWVVLLAIGALLLAFRGQLGAAETPSGRLGRFAMGLLVLVAAGNAVQAFISTGPPPYLGQGDPIRLSLNPRYWVWSLAELEGAVSWRGAWTIPHPDITSLSTDPARGPLAALPGLPVREWRRVAAPLDGSLTDLAWSADGTRALAVTDEYGVYVLDSTLTRVQHRVVLDRGFSIDLTPLAGAAVLGDTLAVLSDNKSYVLLRPDPQADPVLEYRHFLETDGTVSELRRGRFATVRARQQYVASLAYDAAADELITVSVPSPRHQRLVVSRFDRGDLVLSSEFLPALAPGLALASPERSVAEYVVTGAAVADGTLYVVSAAYATLLVIDLADRTLVGAYALPGVERPVGLAVRGDQLLIAQADGRVLAAGRPPVAVQEAVQEAAR